MEEIEWDGELIWGQRGGGKITNPPNNLTPATEENVMIIDVDDINQRELTISRRDENQDANGIDSSISQLLEYPRTPMDADMFNVFTVNVVCDVNVSPISLELASVVD